MSTPVSRPSGYTPGKYSRRVFFNADGTLGEILRLGSGGGIQASDGDSYLTTLDERIGKVGHQPAEEGAPYIVALSWQPGLGWEGDLSGLRAAMGAAQTPIPVTEATTGVFGQTYEVFSSATFTDPSTPQEGGYIVRIRNGTATIGGVAYTEGVWWRVWHSGGWTTRRVGSTNSAVPATATSAGTPGQTAYDSTHFYICTATNTWKRVAIASW